MELLSTLKTCPVPQDVQTLLDHIAPVKDTQRCNLKFIPSFAAFSFSHDFSYSVPIHTFLEIHDILATNRTNTDPGLIMAKIYNTKLATIGAIPYTISNLFGGPYTLHNDTFQHRNWFCSALEAFINPVVTRALVQRPKFAKIKTVPISAPTSDEINGYHYLLGNPLQNDSPLTYFLSDLKRFYNDTVPSCAPLGIAFSKSAGLNIMTHSIEPICLPTSHKLDVIKTDDLEKSPPSISILSDTEFAKKINFLVPGPTFSEKFPYPEDTKTFVPALYRVTNQAYDKSTDPIQYISFNPRMHVAPYVLWLQPYNKSSQSIEISLTAGFKII